MKGNTRDASLDRTFPRVRQPGAHLNAQPKPSQRGGRLVLSMRRLEERVLV
jgi:hypothetical protein